MDRPAVRSTIYAYPCSWAPGRVVRRPELALRYGLTANTARRFPIRKNTDSAAQALHWARRHAIAGVVDVCVRDRFRRRCYLTEAMLEALAAEETPHAHWPQRREATG